MTGSLTRQLCSPATRRPSCRACTSCAPNLGRRWPSTPHTTALLPRDLRPCILRGAGVCFYPEATLPGYSAIFKHANEELNFCYYLIPGGDGDGQCGNVYVCPKPQHLVAICEALGPQLLAQSLLTETPIGSIWMRDHLTGAPI